MEKSLAIENSFHQALHNIEVLMRLLVLEWPAERPMPAVLREAPLRSYHDDVALMAALRDALGSLLDSGTPGWILARDVLAAAGHDYGHTGGTDRLQQDGEPAPLTHEEASERHVAKVGLDHGLPPEVVLEAMAGIRATTFYSRPGRERVQALTEFERKLTLADVAGCILPPDEWLTHVGIPVLVEKLPQWRRRMEQIPTDIAALQAEQASLPNDHPDRARAAEKLKEVLAEDARIIKDLAEWFRSERGFFIFIESTRLRAVPAAVELWGPLIRDRIALVERVLADHDRLVPLAAKGFEFLEWYATELSHAPDLQSWLEGDGVDPNLRGLLQHFLPVPRS
jgi:hypothetical protein